MIYHKIERGVDDVMYVGDVMAVQVLHSLL